MCGRAGIIRISNRGLRIADHEDAKSEEQERFWITYNGEIYNYRELKEELRIAE
jgi:asparagine synthetase B (glutamine-hydrolysing)